MNYNCPGCGSPIDFEEKYSKVISCKYCNWILEFGGWELSKIWEQWVFIDFPTIFEIGRNIEYNAKNIYVKWQLRYEYDGWFFDKFYVNIDWKESYIKEDDGIITILSIWGWQNSSIHLLDKTVWDIFEFVWEEIFIQEKGTFKLTNLKWSINEILIPWVEYEYLDWVSKWKMVYLEKPINEDKIRISREI